MMKIYTKKGDTGETGLFDGSRIPKNSPAVEAYGSVDELNALLGYACALLNDPEIRGVLLGVQKDLFVIGAQLANPSKRKHRDPSRFDLRPERVSALEECIDRWEAQLPPLNAFILPGGTPEGALLHLARTVCRRAERRIVSLAELAALPPTLLPYINRLSDALFVLARLVNHKKGAEETPW